MAHAPIDRKRLVATLGVLLFALLLWWLTQLVDIPELPIVRPAPSGPDYIIEGLDTAAFNANGRRSYHLRAKHFSHYPTKALSVLRNVRLTQFRADGTIIITEAREAELPDDNRELRMRGNVRIIQKRGGRVISDINTDQARVILE